MWQFLRLEEDAEGEDILWDYEWFKQEIRGLTGIDLNGYKEKQMKRRINTLIERKGLDGYHAYVEALRRDEKMLAYFVDYITINVTEFFRTEEHWRYLEEKIFPLLLSGMGQTLRVWSAGCATGEEAYSLAFCLAQYLPLERFRILATDLDETVLSKARKGRYSAKAIDAVPELWRQKYFVPVCGEYQVTEEIRERICFQRLDLLQESYPKGCDLIVCRNVLIYFTEEAKNRMFQDFWDSLRRGGCLFLGNTEQIIYYKQFGYSKQRPCFYSKP